MNRDPVEPSHSRSWWTDRHRQRLLWAYVALLFTATHWPGHWSGAEYGLQFDHVDKLVHLSAFTVLGWLVAWAWPSQPCPWTWRQLLGIWLLVVMYAAVDELLQPYVNRRCDLLDWVADAMGAAIGLGFRAWQNRKLQ